MRIWWMAIWLVLAGTTAAQDLPPIQFYLSTAYVCGGIGSDQAAAFKSARSLYPLSLNFGQKQGDRVAFAADVQVVMRDTQDQTVLNFNSDGPYCLIDIDPGSYHVYVTYEGQTLQQAITVINQGHQLNFVWSEQPAIP